MFKCWGNRKDERKKQDFFLKNGAEVLEQVISLHNGKCNPIGSYSAQQLQNATGDFRWMIHEGWNYDLYKGIHEGREILVKRFTSYKDDQLERIASEVAIASRMSNHKNVLKLLGCCLETELPLLVYEFPVLGNLGSHVYRPGDNQLPWELKLRIVTEVANAVAYLHHGLSKMIIHRDIKPTNVFLDRNDAAKLFEFQEAIPIPEGETHVDAELLGTLWFIAPESIITNRRHYAESSDAVATSSEEETSSDVEAGSRGRYTEKSDVYGFGVLLCEVLIGKRIHELLSWHSELSYRRNSDSKLRSDDYLGEIIGEYCEIYLQEENRMQVTEYVKLVQRCVKFNPAERPNIIEVEKTLRFIKSI